MYGPSREPSASAICGDFTDYMRNDCTDWRNHRLHRLHRWECVVIAQGRPDSGGRNSCSNGCPMQTPQHFQAPDGWHIACSHPWSMRPSFGARTDRRSASDQLFAGVGIAEGAHPQLRRPIAPVLAESSLAIAGFASYGHPPICVICVICGSQHLCNPNRSLYCNPVISRCASSQINLSPTLSGE
jgi:hypothetical protein